LKARGNNVARWIDIVAGGLRYAEERSYDSSHLTSSNFISTDLISSQLRALVATGCSEVDRAPRRTTQFAVAATSHSQRSDEMRSDDGLYERSLVMLQCRDENDLSLR